MAAYNRTAVLEDLRARSRELKEREREIRQELERIIAEQRELEPAVSYFEKLTGASGDAEREPSDEQKKRGRFAGMSTPEAAVRYLAERGHPEKTKTIAEALEKGDVESDAKNFYSTLYTTLRRLAEQGEIVKLEDSRWSLPQYVPAESTNSEDPEDGELALS